MNNILEKITKLLNFFKDNKGDTQDVGAIVSWEEQAKRLFLLKNLKEHDGIKYLLEIFEGEVAKINEVLKNSYSKDLPDKERDRLLDRREMAQKYLDLFLPVEEGLEKLEETLDDELSKLA